MLLTEDIQVRGYNLTVHKLMQSVPEDKDYLQKLCIHLQPYLADPSEDNFRLAKANFSRIDCYLKDGKRVW